VLRSDVLTDLYGTPVDVIRSGGRIVVVGIPDSETHQHHDEGHRPAAETALHSEPVA
jgi:zinc/manganese transport system ATP-binding protein